MTTSAGPAGQESNEQTRSLKETAADIGERQKSAGADQLTGVASAVHAAADELDRQLPGAAGYVHQAASRIEDAAAGLRNRSLSDLIEDVRHLAHERPFALFGGAVVAGFALSRFLKSGVTHTDADRARSDSTTGA
jgi:hypothetical protein